MTLISDILETLKNTFLFWYFHSVCISWFVQPTEGLLVFHLCMPSDRHTFRKNNECVVSSQLFLPAHPTGLLSRSTANVTRIKYSTWFLPLKCTPQPSLSLQTIQSQKMTGMLKSHPEDFQALPRPASLYWVHQVLQADPHNTDSALLHHLSNQSY